MVFYCGRPQCGREATATLQIDAVSATVTLVDPRESREGVALCAHHADITTPPMGWSMNDLRGNRTLNVVPQVGSEATGRVSPNEPADVASSRPAAATPVRPTQRKPVPGKAAAVIPAEKPVAETDDDGPATADGQLRFAVSHELDSTPLRAQRAARHRGADGAGGTMLTAPSDLRGDVDQQDPTTVLRSSEERTRHRLTAGSSVPETAPSSRPSKRREKAQEPEETEDKFPWHFQFKDDEPAELQAKSPLLARAFRYSVG